jgi:F-box/TPR repeat protein Pof3
MILEYLSFKQMVNCMPVSRGWKDYLSKLPKLWMHLDLSGARRPVPRSFVSKAVKRSQDRVNRVTIHRFEHVDMLKNMAQMCKELRDLDIISLPYKVSASLIQMVQSARQLKKIVVRNEISLETATAILTNGPGLEHVSFYNLMRTTRYAAEWKGPFPNLKTFQVFGMDTFLESYFQTASFLEQAPALSSLELPSLNIIAPSIGLETLSSLTTLILKRTKFLSFPVLPTSLQNLTIEYDGSFNLLSTNIDTGLLRCRLPNLTHLTLHGFDGLCPEKLEELLDLYMDDAGTIHALQPATPLTSLSIHGVLHISPQQAQNTLFHPNPHSLLTRSPRILTTSLQHLDIASLPCTDDDIEQLLGHEVAGLQSIDVSWTNVTGAGIKMLADGIKGLKVIRADQCRRITGRDAILYAERKGIVVSCQMGEGKGGRKVRYG